MNVGRTPSLLAALLWIASSACTNGVTLGFDGPRSCGRTLCGPGEYCCNESCGICAPIGAACIAIACGGPCDPQRVTVDPMCPAFRALGFAWNGAACALLSGCACIGEDCGALYPSLEACEADRAGCVVTPLPCLGTSDCAPAELCDFSEDLSCGSRGTLGTCIARPAACTGVYDPVCGCDGRTHTNACIAETLGVDAAFGGPCDPCAAEDAAVVGTCGVRLGQVWNGLACVELLGCDCSGVDCPLVTSGRDCALAHAGCGDAMRFDCGGAITCARWSEVCVLEASLMPRCEARPMECPADPCSCLSGGMCSDDAAGAVVLFL